MGSGFTGDWDGRRPPVHARPPDQEAAEALTGEELHDLMCADNRPCVRWRITDPRHRDYYRDRAADLTGRLAPVIGSANVKLAVQTVAEVLL